VLAGLDKVSKYFNNTVDNLVKPCYNNSAAGGLGPHRPCCTQYRNRGSSPQRSFSPQGATMSKQQAWDIIRNGQIVDTVFFDRDMTLHDVRSALIKHDGYSADITVRLAR